MSKNVSLYAVPESMFNVEYVRMYSS